MKNKEEIWKDIEEFEGLYQVSDRGRVKSLGRTRGGRNGSICSVKERILKPGTNSCGYLMVCLWEDGKMFVKKVHTLVWDAFGDKPRNGRILQVDHINNCKTDNRIENLQLLNPRENVSKGKMQKNKSSIYSGVYWNKQKNKWQAKININKKQIHLGYFTSETESAEAYQKAKQNLLKNI